MKKLSVLFLSLVAMSTTFVSCGNDDNPAPAPAPTALQLTVKDDLGAVQNAAAVKLYGSLNDLNSGKNQVGTTQTSGTDGKVKFSNLEAKQYFFDIVAGCRNNIFGGTFKTEAAIAANKTTEMDATVTPTATVSFENTSTNDWGVSIGQTALYLIDANTSPSGMMPAGDYTITMVELDTAGTPTGVTKDVPVTLTCGGTGTVTVP